MAKVPYGVETSPKISIAWVGCTNVTDRRQTDDRRQTTDRQTDGPSMTYSEHELEFTFAKNYVPNFISIADLRCYKSFFSGHSVDAIQYNTIFVYYEMTLHLDMSHFFVYFEPSPLSHFLTFYYPTQKIVIVVPVRALLPQTQWWQIRLRKVVLYFVLSALCLLMSEAAFARAYIMHVM